MKKLMKFPRIQRFIDRENRIVRGPEFGFQVLSVRRTFNASIETVVKVEIGRHKVLLTPEEASHYASWWKSNRDRYRSPRKLRQWWEENLDDCSSSDRKKMKKTGLKEIWRLGLSWEEAQHVYLTCTGIPGYEPPPPRKVIKFREYLLKKQMRGMPFIWW